MDGRGAPVLLLHGWINSWDVWRETMIDIADRCRFKVYALDFWGFGESAKKNTAPFRLDSYVSMVYQFMEIMGIYQAPIIGHSMGGTVALKMILAYPDQVSQAAVVGSPIVGSSLNLLLKLGGVGWIAHTLFRLPFMLRLVVWCVLSGDSKRVQDMIFRDVSKTNAESFFRSIGDLRRTDLRPCMDQIHIPTLGVFGEHDNIVHPGQSKILAQSIPQAQIQMMSHSRHFPMVDEPQLFRDTLISFLSNGEDRC
jgi:3-oxoadipate enol-lactonase